MNIFKMYNSFLRKIISREALAEVKNEKGITLVELLISVIIFSIVMIAVVGILISAIKSNQRIVAKQENIDSARYSMEFMIKELRMAKSIDGAYKNNIFTAIQFQNSADQTVNYSYDSTNKRIIRNDGTASGDQPISSGDIDVTTLNFFINNWDLTALPATDRRAPLVTIFIKMKGKTGVAANEIIDLQSSVSPRIY